MTPDERAWLALVIFGPIPWLALAFLYRLGVRPFGPQRCRATPWGVPDVLVLLAALVPQFVLALRGLLVERDDKPPAAGVAAVQFGLLVEITLPIVLLTVRGARLYQMGIHCDRLLTNVAAGVASFFLSLPLIGAAFLASTLFFEPKKHQVEQLLRGAPTLGNFVLLGALVVVAGPAFEELIFRGILLPGLKQRFGAWPAIIGSSAIFAALHVDAWPAPIPLFVLALFLGYLAHRTGSLVGPVILHATFNGANMIALGVELTRSS